MMVVMGSYVSVVYSNYGLCVFLFLNNIDRKGESDYGIFLICYGRERPSLSNFWMERRRLSNFLDSNCV